jgi:hypothetical protein
MMQSQSIQQRFETKVEYIPFAECHYWTAATTKFGYGKLADGNKGWMLAHRFAWEQKNGEIPKEMLVLHHCDNPYCVNVKHLYLGNHQDNARDRELRNRGNHASELNHGSNKLLPSQVYEIRDAYDTGKYSFRQLGKIYGIDGKSVADIIDRKNWSNLH